MAEETETPIPKTKEITSENIELKKKKKTRIITLVLVCFIVLALVLVKISNPELSFRWILIPSGAVIFVGLIIFFFSNIKEYYLKLTGVEKKIDEEKVPKAISQEEFLEKLNNFFSKWYENHIKEKGEIETYNVNKNQIYEIEVSLLYDRTTPVYVYFNANYPDFLPTIRFKKASPPARLTIVNRMSSNPEALPDIEETTEKSPLTGVEIQRKKTTHKKKSKSKVKPGEEFE